MKDLPNSLITESQKLYNTSPWYILYQIRLNPTNEWMYLVRNMEDVIYNGKTYKPFPITSGNIREDLKGSLYGVDIQISNVSKELQTYLETSEDNLRDQPVNILVVHEDHLSDPTAYFMETFTIDSIDCNRDSAVFHLVHFSFFTIGRPQFRFIRNECRRIYKDPNTCKYAGSASSCNKTFDNCIIRILLLNGGSEFRANTGPDVWMVGATQHFRYYIPFGGFPTIPKPYEV